MNKDGYITERIDLEPIDTDAVMNWIIWGNREGKITTWK